LQPWYALNLLIFVPYFYRHLAGMQILFFGLLVSYYPIIRFGVWEPDPGFNLKNAIVYGAMVLNLVWSLINIQHSKS
jgi:hypothetical protein